MTVLQSLFATTVSMPNSAQAPLVNIKELGTKISKLTKEEIDFLAQFISKIIVLRSTSEGEFALTQQSATIRRRPNSSYSHTMPLDSLPVVIDEELLKGVKDSIILQIENAFGSANHFAEFGVAFNPHQKVRLLDRYALHLTIDQTNLKITPKVPFKVVESYNREVVFSHSFSFNYLETLKKIENLNEVVAGNMAYYLAKNVVHSLTPERSVEILSHIFSENDSEASQIELGNRKSVIATKTHFHGTSEEQRESLLTLLTASYKKLILDACSQANNFLQNGLIISISEETAGVILENSFKTVGLVADLVPYPLHYKIKITIDYERSGPELGFSVEEQSENVIFSSRSLSLELNPKAVVLEDLPTKNWKRV